MDHVNVQLIYDMFVDELLMMDPKKEEKVSDSFFVSNNK